MYFQIFSFLRKHAWYVMKYYYSSSYPTSPSTFFCHWNKVIVILISITKRQKKRNDNRKHEKWQLNLNNLYCNSFLCVVFQAKWNILYYILVWILNSRVCKRSTYLKFTNRWMSSSFWNKYLFCKRIIPLCKNWEHGV